MDETPSDDDIEALLSSIERTHSVNRIFNNPLISSDTASLRSLILSKSPRESSLLDSVFPRNDQLRVEESPRGLPNHVQTPGIDVFRKRSVESGVQTDESLLNIEALLLKFTVSVEQLNAQIPPSNGTDQPGQHDSPLEPDHDPLVSNTKTRERFLDECRAAVNNLQSDIKELEVLLRSQEEQVRALALPMGDFCDALRDQLVEWRNIADSASENRMQKMELTDLLEIINERKLELLQLERKATSGTNTAMDDYGYQLKGPLPVDINQAVEQLSDIREYLARRSAAVALYSDEYPKPAFTT